MAATGNLRARSPTATSSWGASGRGSARAALWIRLGCAAGVALGWEALARSGLLLRDVVPSLLAIVAAMGRLLVDPAFYGNLAVTGWEVAASLAIGTAAGVFVGILLGANRFLSRAYEPYVYYLAPTPRIILFPIMIMWFGVGMASKIALGALSCFFTVALSTAAGMRGIDKTLIKVGRGFRATPWQMATKIYLPAMRTPVLTGVRLGFGTAVITALLAETKLSNQGLGYMVMQIYQTFNMAALYGLLAIIFVIAGAGNVLLGRLSGGRG